jgi:hypothetical protein
MDKVHRVTAVLGFLSKPNNNLLRFVVDFCHPGYLDSFLVKVLLVYAYCIGPDYDNLTFVSQVTQSNGKIFGDGEGMLV